MPTLIQLRSYMCVNMWQGLCQAGAACEGSAENFGNLASSPRKFESGPEHHGYLLLCSS